MVEVIECWVSFCTVFTNAGCTPLFVRLLYGCFGMLRDSFFIYWAFIPGIGLEPYLPTSELLAFEFFRLRRIFHYVVVEERFPVFYLVFCIDGIP